MNSNILSTGFGGKIAAFAVAALVALGSSAQAQEAEATATPEAPVIEEMTLGPADAKVTVIEYASYVCPHCASFHKNQYKQLKADYIDTGKIQFIYRDVYAHKYVLWASMVARCGGSEKFFGINDLLYDQQSEWIGSGQDDHFAVGNLRKIGKVAGLDDAALDACLSDNAKAKALVEWYKGNAETHTINGTPTLVINDKSYGNMRYEDLKELIEEELNS